MAILESGETYVESIYILSLESDIVRGKDISEYMGVTRPSVSRAINSLKERGLVKSGSGGSIKLTEIASTNSLVIKALFILVFPIVCCCVSPQVFDRFQAMQTAASWPPQTETG